MRSILTICALILIVVTAGGCAIASAVAGSANTAKYATTSPDPESIDRRLKKLTKELEELRAQLRLLTKAN